MPISDFSFLGSLVRSIKLVMLVTDLLTSTLHILQRVQNAAVQLIYLLRPGDYIGSSLWQLHWLPIQLHMLYIVKCIQAPKCISDCVSTVTAVATRSRLCSIKTNKLLSTKAPD